MNTESHAPAETPDAWFHGARRVLFVHAHPDDETIVTGGTLAALSEYGCEPGLVTLTRGEQGEVTPGPFAHLAGTAALAAHRETELAGALFMLGVTRHSYLGAEPARAGGALPRVYADSGMQWGVDGRATAANSAPADALTRAPAHEALADLVAVAAEWEAEAIVSYHAGGGYGHPDHVFAHKLARAVSHGLDLPFWEILDEAPVQASAEPTETTAATLTVSYDIEPWMERKVAALRAHGTQLRVDGDEIVHVGGQREAIRTVEHFKLLPPLG